MYRYRKYCSLRAFAVAVKFAVCLCVTDAFFSTYHHKGPGRPCCLPPPFRLCHALTAELMHDAQQMSPTEGWGWRGRKGSGVVKGVQGLGMLQHLRDSRLIPYRLGCNCLYEHPGLKHLLNGRQSRQGSLRGTLKHLTALRRKPGRFNDLDGSAVMGRWLQWRSTGSC